MPQEVDVSAVTPERFRSLMAPDRFEAFERGVREARELLDGRVVWNVNSTARSEPSAWAGARERVREEFLSVRSLLHYLALIRRMLCSLQSVTGT